MKRFGVLVLLLVLTRIDSALMKFSMAVSDLVMKVEEWPSSREVLEAIADETTP